MAAFDHRHIFLDPDPDPATSFAERQRLFALARSSWTDYDRSLISAGGGVWPRSAKSVPLSPQARAALGVDDTVLALSPDELISRILTAPVDLLWNGGIGTYIKATSEPQTACGDRANEAVRVNASQLRAQVVAEGGNLGLTQAARIEFAVGGGLVDTDFIDNSAGVDTSDHEVNIKILLDRAVRDGEISHDARNTLLQEMTDEVAALVLRHNYHQNMALATARAQAPQMLHVHARYLRMLERGKRLRRGQDAVPGEKEIAERRSAGKGLTNPELALLLAHTKIAAAEEVLASGLADDPYLRRELTGYFPAPLRACQAGRMQTHPLRHEIITTSVVNEMVDTSGTTFAFRLNEETGASVPDITRAWLVAREVFGMRDYWRQVTALDAVVDIGTQIALLLEGRKLVERACRWLLYNRRPPVDITGCVDYFGSGVLAVRSGLPKLLVGRDAETFEERRDAFIVRDVPAGLAETVAGMVPSYSAFDIVESAAATSRGVEETAEVYFDLADRLQITRLRDRITALPRDDRWSSMARAAIRDDLYAAHAALTRDVLCATGPGTPRRASRPGPSGTRRPSGGRPGPWARSGRASASRSRPFRSRCAPSGPWSPPAPCPQRSCQVGHHGGLRRGDRYRPSEPGLRPGERPVCRRSTTARASGGSGGSPPRPAPSGAVDVGGGAARADHLEGARLRGRRGVEREVAERGVHGQPVRERPVRGRHQAPQRGGHRDTRQLRLAVRGWQVGRHGQGGQGHGVEDQGAAARRAQREERVAGSLQLPAVRRVLRGGLPGDRRVGLVQPGGLRPGLDDRGGGTGRPVVRDGRVHRAHDVRPQLQRAVRRGQGGCVTGAVDRHFQRGGARIEQNGPAERPGGLGVEPVEHQQRGPDRIAGGGALRHRGHEPLRVRGQLGHVQRRVPVDRADHWMRLAAAYVAPVMLYCDPVSSDRASSSS